MARSNRQPNRKKKRDGAKPNDANPVGAAPTVAKTGVANQLVVTPQQRQLLLERPCLKRKIRAQLKEAGNGPLHLTVSRDDLDYLYDEASDATLCADTTEKEQLKALLQVVTEMLDEGSVKPRGEAETNLPRTKPATGDAIFQFQIMLLDIEPPIWRRIQIRDCKLDVLHEYIQIAFGWENCHLHQFDIDGVRFSIPSSEDFFLKIQDETQVYISELLPKKGKPARWLYEYDFGDTWMHEIVFEGYLPADNNAKYPRCLEGARACPPEDCGGPWGYCDLVEALTDPAHERHEELLDWIGTFEPEAFSAKKATTQMRKVAKYFEQPQEDE